jgi:hypothetical protein
MGYLWEPTPVGDGLFVGAHPCGRWAWNTPCKPSPTGGLLQRQKYGPFKLHRAGSVTRRHGPRLGGRGDRGRFLVFPCEHCLSSRTGFVCRPRLVLSVVPGWHCLSSRTSIVCRLGWHCLSSRTGIVCRLGWLCLSSGLALSVFPSYFCLSSRTALSVVPG